MRSLQRWSFPILSGVLLAAGALSGGPAHAASTYYVSVEGSDANGGSQSAPWRTVQKAADVAKAGDTVVVEPGTYVGAKFSHSGASGSPIQFLAQPGVVIDQPGPAQLQQ
jgi:hypothetical protein